MRCRLRCWVSGAWLASVILTGNLYAGDWPQWRGPNRDGHVSGFKAPASWPKELTRKWRIEVGDGVATPALVGDKLYVFSRQDGKEVVRCLEAANGDEVWRDEYQANGARGPASSYSGPRSSPTVAEGKVITLGTDGILSCYDAASGKVLWRKTDQEGSVPRFSASSSPIVVDGKCIAQLGSSDNGFIIAYDLASGEPKWKWSGDGPAYGSPVLMEIDGLKVVVAPTNRKMVAISTDKGALMRDFDYRQGRYNAATPIGLGQTLIFAGPERGITAEKLKKDGDKLTAEKLWSNPENSVQFNTPVVKDDLLYGLSTQNSLFALNLANGNTVWTNSSGEAAGPQVREQRPQEAQKKRGRSRGRGGRRGGRAYGSIVDAGTVLMALTPDGSLVVFQPGDTFVEHARYNVSDGGAHAYPVISGNRIFIKDQNNLTLWTIES